MGKNIVVNHGTDNAPHYVRVPFDDTGKLGESIDIPADPLTRGSPTINRAGPRWVMQSALASRQPKLRYFDGDAWSPPVLPPLGEGGARMFVASSSGSFSVDRRMVCGEGGCAEVFSEKDTMLAQLGGKPDRTMRTELDRVGDRVLYAWGADDGNGLFVHVGAPGAPKEGTDVVIMESSGIKAPLELGVFGGAEVALVLARLEKKMIGVRVLKDGSVAPAKVSWK